MPKINWNQRFQESTRGRVISLLQRGDQTVTDLAEGLKITDNAVRTHLISLERDGLVEQRGLRRGTGAPAYVYGLTSAADALLSKAYALALTHVLAVIGERVEETTLKDLLREAGRRAAAGKVPPSGNLRERVDSAVEMFGELGGAVEVEESVSHLYIRGNSCPLSSVVADRPEVCVLAEALLTEVIGVKVKENCDRAGSRPHCCFEVPRQSATPV